MLLIMSMHRSGSSLLTGLLHSHGLNAGNEVDMMPKNRDNSKGFWERRDIVELNESFLASGMHSHMMPNLKAGPNYPEGTDQKVAELVGHLTAEKIDVIKDPRFALTLPVWRPVLPELKVVLLVRHPMQVAHSLLKRQAYPLPAGLALWEYYNYQALQHTQDLPCKTVLFDELITSPDLVTQQIMAWYDVAQPLTFNQQSDKPFFDSALVHHHGQQDVSQLTDSQQLLWEYLQAPNKLYQGPYESPSMSLTFELMEAFFQIGYTPNTGRMVDQRASDELKYLHSERKSLQAEVKRLNNEAKKIAKLQQELSHLRSLVNNLIQSRVGHIVKHYYNIRHSWLTSNPTSSLIDELEKALKENDDKK